MKSPGDRIQTGAAERTEQNHRLVDAVSTDVGRDVTVREAQSYRRKYKGVNDLTREKLAAATDIAEPVGAVLAKIEGFRTHAGGACNLSLMANAREFGDVLMEASLLSQSEVLVISIGVVPRDLGLEAELGGLEDGDDG